MNSFVLKIIAIITMAIDHTGYLVFGHFSYFNYIGRLAFPIFAFQISEGYKHTKNLKKYFIRLILFAIISQIPFMLFHSIISKEFALNIFFTLILGLIAIIAYDKIPSKIIGILISIALGLIANLIKADYGFYGVAIILLFHIFKDNKNLMAISFVIATIAKYSKNLYTSDFHQIYMILCACTVLPIIFISLYNGKKGKDTKYLLYLFYPLHLLLIYGIHLLK